MLQGRTVGMVTADVQNVAFTIKKGPAVRAGQVSNASCDERWLSVKSYGRIPLKFHTRAGLQVWCALLRSLELAALRLMRTMCSPDAPRTDAACLPLPPPASLSWRQAAAVGDDEY